MSMRNLASPTSNTSLDVITDDMVQPNAVDITADRIITMNNDLFTITNEFKGHRSRKDAPLNDKNLWVLNPGTYEVVCEKEISIGQGEAGFVITRSTLNRNGVFITSGLYDTGYVGSMSMVMHVTGGPMHIEKGTRVGQFLVFEAEALHDYDGDYGTGKVMEQALYKS